MVVALLSYGIQNRTAHSITLTGLREYAGILHSEGDTPMAVRQIFALANDFAQGDEIGICTVASLQWAKVTLRLGRGVGAFNELGLSPHQLNALMAVWRRFDGNPAAQTAGMGLQIVGADRPVNQFIDVQRFVNLTPPHMCIFWTAEHTMGYCAQVRQERRECEFFDMECGFYLADNDSDIRATVLAQFAAGGYTPIIGMRIVSL
jgi:hypothetical protein